MGIGSVAPLHLDEGDDVLVRIKASEESPGRTFRVAERAPKIVVAANPPGPGGAKHPSGAPGLQLAAFAAASCIKRPSREPRSV
jgi:hypothetical protein